MHSKTEIQNYIVQNLFRPFFISLPVEVALDCAMSLLEKLLLSDMISRSQYDYLLSLATAYRDILSE